MEIGAETLLLGWKGTRSLLQKRVMERATLFTTKLPTGLRKQQTTRKRRSALRVCAQDTAASKVAYQAGPGHGDDLVSPGSNFCARFLLCSQSVAVNTARRPSGDFRMPSSWEGVHPPPGASPIQFSRSATAMARTRLETRQTGFRCSMRQACLEGWHCHRGSPIE